MLSKPSVGWTTVKLGDFEDRASYLTDVPHDCLDAFIYTLENHRPAVVFFDAEGWNYHIVFSYYTTYILMEKDELEVYEVELDFTELAKELVDDIEQNIDDWANWDICFEDEFIENKKLLEEKTFILKELLKL